MKKKDAFMGPPPLLAWRRDVGTVPSGSRVHLADDREDIDTTGLPRFAAKIVTREGRRGRRGRRRRRTATPTLRPQPPDLAQWAPSTLTALVSIRMQDHAAAAAAAKALDCRRERHYQPGRRRTLLIAGGRRASDGAGRNTCADTARSKSSSRSRSSRARGLFTGRQGGLSGSGTLVFAAVALVLWLGCCVDVCLGAGLRSQAGARHSAGAHAHAHAHASSHAHAHTHAMDAEKVAAALSSRLLTGSSKSSSKSKSPPHGYELIWKQMQRDGRAKAMGSKYAPPLKGRLPAFEPPVGFEDDSHYAFGFFSDYYCIGRLYDEPRRMRLSCTKNPVRKMNCKCSEPRRNSRQVPCRCEPAMANGGVKKINLIDKVRKQAGSGGESRREGSGGEWGRGRGRGSRWGEVAELGEGERKRSTRFLVLTFCFVWFRIVHGLVHSLPTHPLQFVTPDPAFPDYVSPVQTPKTGR